MSTVQGVHIIAKGEPTMARRIADDIRQHQRLLAGSGFYGVGAYAYYADQVPHQFQNAPQVLFEIDDSRIREITVNIRGSQFCFFRIIPDNVRNPLYVSIRVIEFINVDE